MKMYCQKCGSGTAYNMQKPKFCQNCGSSFNNEVKARHESKNYEKVAKKTSGLAQKRNTSRDNIPSPTAEDLEEENLSVPNNINKLEFDVVGSLEVKGTTVANLAGTLSPNEKSKAERGLGPKINKEEFLQDFQREAGTSRPRK